MSAITANPLDIVLPAAQQHGKVRRYQKGYYATRSPNREDNHPSILFGLTQAGNLWIKDLAGKETPAEILTGWGLNPDTLKPETRDIKPQRKQPQRRRIRLDFNHPHATYNYLTADGQPSYQQRRVNFTGADGQPDKSFQQWRWEDGRWQPGRGDTPELLYNLPQVIKAQRVLGVEGEKAAEALRGLGYVATTHAGGAKAIDKALPAYRQWLRDKEIIVLPDNDQPGRDMARTLTAELGPIVRSGATVDPALFGGEKADIADVINRLKKELLSDSDIRAEIDQILDQAQPWQRPIGPKESARLAQREKYLAEARANLPPQLTPLKFESVLEDAELDKCEITVEHHVWTSEGGKGKTFFYCNDPTRCALCRERHTLKLRFYLEEIARLAYVDENGNAAYSQPELNEAGEFASATRGHGTWYGKIFDWDDYDAENSERRAFRARYREHKPGGFIKPEVYPIVDGELKFVVLSLAPFEDMQPIELTDDLLQRIAIGAPRLGARASLLFGPSRKQLELALPRYTFEIPQYLNERGIVATIPAPHSVLFNGPVKAEDIYSGFKTKAETFDDIGLILEEVAEKSIDSGRLRGTGDHAPDYVIQSIHIVPEAKPAYLAVYNAGREGDLTIIKKFKRGGLPKMPTLKSPPVIKGIYGLNTIPLMTDCPDQDSYPPFYYAHLEHLLQIGAI